MADRNIVTQVGIEELKYVLSEIAENLSAHTNASLSKAHGINVLAGYTDEYGNDLTTYQDSLGNVMGTHFLRFTVNNTVYYAPATATALDGQSESSGSIDTSAEGEYENQSKSSWVTDYTSEQVTQAESINNDVLLEHTNEPHWDTHGGMSVSASNTYNSAGGLVGTHLIALNVNDVVHTIPVTTRFGGPIQAPRFGLIPTVIFNGPINGNFGMVGTDIIEHVEGGESWPDSVVFRTTVSGGTFPMSYKWQFSANNAQWADMDVSRETDNGCGYYPVGGTGVGTLSAAVPYFDALFGLNTPGGDDSATFFMRLVIESDAGTFYGTTLRVLQKDEEGCFITTAVCSATGLGDNCYELELLRKFREHYMRKRASGRALLAEYDIVGPRIVEHLKALPDFKEECVRLFSSYISPAVAAIERKQAAKAFNLYCLMVQELRSKFGIS